jgi:hypothetical protein
LGDTQRLKVLILFLRHSKTDGSRSACEHRGDQATGFSR